MELTSCMALSVCLSVQPSVLILILYKHKKWWLTDFREARYSPCTKEFPAVTSVMNNMKTVYMWASEIGEMLGLLNIRYSYCVHRQIFPKYDKNIQGHF
jgi:hypothetical protein